GVLRGDNLAPPVDTDGLGSVQLAVVGEELAWIVSFYDLESPPTAVQVYDPDGSGENANVLLDLGKNWGDLGRNNIMAGKAMLNTDQRTSLSSGKLYLLVRTQAHPDGELRAQLQRFN
ncbi:MAG: CHRD domain-containing protein, partial [Alphaproteobacteria bacterium]|nr:CHRD domain-containing protein [Alphaproteobacteria bacterium]